MGVYAMMTRFQKKGVSLILYITLIILLTYENALTQEPSLFGFPVNNIFRFRPDYSFNIKNVHDIDNYVKKMDSLIGEDGYTWSDNLYSSICFENLNEKQIDSVIHEIHDPRLIVELVFKNCPIKMIPDSVKLLYDLYSISFNNCDSIRNMNGFNSNFPVFGINFNNCKINQLPDGIENFGSMLRLMIRVPVDANKLDIDKELRKFRKRKNIIDLFIKYDKLSDFPNSIFQLSSLQTLIFYSRCIKHYPADFDKLNNLMYLYISSFDDRVDESAKKNKNLQFLKRLNTGDSDTNFMNFKYNFEWGRCEFSNTLEHNSNHHLIFSPGGLVTDYTNVYGINNKEILIKVENIKQIISIYFKDAKPSDKLLVQITDKKNKILFNGRIKNRNCELDLKDLPFEETYMKININSFSKEFNIKKTW